MFRNNSNPRGLIGLSKLGNVVNNEIDKINVYGKLVAKLNAIDTRGFVLKTKYDTDKSVLENKLHNISGLVKKQTIMLKLSNRK